jgi:hypothetical protein
MPANLVKSPEDEKLWEKAKAAAAKKGGELNMAVVNHIYLRMKAAGKKVAAPQAQGGI